jgi:phosphatidylserine synthase
MQPAANDLGGNLALAGQLLRYLADCMTIPGLALAILGIGWAFKRDWRRALYVVPAATYLVILFAQVRYGQLRYVMPASVVLVAFAGYAVLELVSVGSRLGRPGRLAGVLALAAVVLLGVLRGADITYEMVKDSRSCWECYEGRTSRMKW